MATATSPTANSLTLDEIMENHAYAFLGRIESLAYFNDRKTDFDGLFELLCKHVEILRGIVNSKEYNGAYRQTLDFIGDQLIELELFLHTTPTDRDLCLKLGYLHERTTELIQAASTHDMEEFARRKDAAKLYSSYMQSLVYGLLRWEVDGKSGDPEFPYILAAMLSFDVDTLACFHETLLNASLRNPQSPYGPTLSQQYLFVKNHLPKVFLGRQKQEAKK